MNNMYIEINSTLGVFEFRKLADETYPRYVWVRQPNKERWVQICDNGAVSGETIATMDDFFETVCRQWLTRYEKSVQFEI